MPPVFELGCSHPCVVGSLAIRHGTSCYFRGTMLPGWMLNGGRLVPVDALGPGPVRGGRLVASRKRLRGVRTAFIVDSLLQGRALVSSSCPREPCPWGSSWFLRFVCLCLSCLVFCPVRLVFRRGPLCLRRPLALPAGVRVTGRRPGLLRNPCAVPFFALHDSARTCDDMCSGGLPSERYQPR